MGECKQCGGWKSKHPDLVSIDPPECQCACWRCGSAEDLWEGFKGKTPARPVCVVCVWELIGKVCDDESTEPRP